MAAERLLGGCGVARAADYAPAVGAKASGGSYAASGKSRAWDCLDRPRFLYIKRDILPPAV